MMRVRPLRDGVVVEILETLTRKEMRPEFVKPEIQKECKVPYRVTAKVLAVGPGDVDAGVLIPVGVSAGDVVLLQSERYDDIDIEYEGRSCVLIDALVIRGVVEE